MKNSKITRRTFLKVSAIGAGGVLLSACGQNTSTVIPQKLKIIGKENGSKMDIGIIYFSHSGHTRFAAQILEEKLSSLGHTVIIEPLKPVEPFSPSAATAQLSSVPEIGTHDLLILASPVNGGRMSAPMNSFLDQTGSLQGRQVIFLVTHFFPRMWGASQTIQAMADKCAAKGAMVVGDADVQWTFSTPVKKVESAVDQISALLQA